MVWTSKVKSLSLYSATPHGNVLPGVVGRAPGFSTLTFGPLDLYGAAARCSHLNMVNPALITPESAMVGALVEHYVDDASSDFAILATAANFKDFVKSYFAGTVASGLAYLAMIDDGYVWSDHFENVGGGNSSATKSPDFVFVGQGTGVALVESKGTRSARLSAFDGTVDTGYVDQVEPHLGYTVGGAMATHGYCIGGWLTSATKAEIIVHHTAAPTSGGGGAQGDAPATAIQRQNYATAFSLAHSARLGEQLRDAGAARYEVPFARVEWRGLTWLTGFPFPQWPWWWDERFPVSRQSPTWRQFLPDVSAPFFAVEENIAKIVLRQFYAYEPGEDAFFIEPLPRDLRFAAIERDTPQSGASFPDGLAIIRSDFSFAGAAIWSPQNDRFETF